MALRLAATGRRGDAPPSAARCPPRAVPRRRGRGVPAPPRAGRRSSLAAAPPAGFVPVPAGWLRAAASAAPRRRIPATAATTAGAGPAPSSTAASHPRRRAPPPPPPPPPAAGGPGTGGAATAEPAAARPVRTRPLTAAPEDEDTRLMPAPWHYLDHAASSPLRPEARAAMDGGARRGLWQPVRRPRAGTGGSLRRSTTPARRWPSSSVPRPGEIVFTSGGTEADNLAVRGVLAARGGTAVCTAIEHKAVLEPVHASGGRVVARRPPGSGGPRRARRPARRHRHARVRSGS